MPMHDLHTAIKNKVLTINDIQLYDVDELSSVDEVAETPLMLAIRYSKTLVPAIIAALGDQAAHNATLKNKYGFTALMLAVKESPDQVPAIIAALGDQAAHNATLQNEYGFTALMLAVKESPDQVPAIIDALGDQAAHNATLCNMLGRNAIHLAKIFHPYILCVLVEIPPDYKNMPFISLGRVVELKKAARYQPNSPPEILEEFMSKKVVLLSSIPDEKRLDYKNIVRNMFDVKNYSKLFQHLKPLLFDIITQNPSEVERLFTTAKSVEIFKDIFPQSRNFVPDHVQHHKHAIQILKGTQRVRHTAGILFMLRDMQKSNKSETTVSTKLDSLPDEIICYIAAMVGPSDQRYYQQTSTTSALDTKHYQMTSASRGMWASITDGDKYEEETTLMSPHSIR